MRISARAIVLKDNNILVMDRNKSGRLYIALPGGGVETDESYEQAAVREVKEECSIDIIKPRLVITLDAGKVYGTQYIFLCEYAYGEPKLDPSSVEAERASKDNNFYTPKWLPIKELKQSNFLPVELKDVIIKYTESGFPDEPVSLKTFDDSRV